jgi:radical SAM superfamily enzyme YgiQ (UPF0313 family)
VNVVLICPKIPDTFWGYKYALPFVGKRAALPPLPLVTIAAMLPKSWNLRLVDTNITELQDSDIAWADYAMITGMAIQKRSALQLIDRCHAAEVPVVCGGPLFTMEPEAYPQVDHLVLDEGEITLPMFLSDLEAGKPQRIYRAGEQRADLTQSPVPMWHLLDLGAYAMVGIQYSRGCPFDCDFCAVTTMLGHKHRVKTPQQIIAELNALRDAGWAGPVFFVDDNLIGSPRRLKAELLPALIKWQTDRGPIEFITQLSINLADNPELTAMMVEAGFITVFVGIETPAEASLVECKKTQNRRRDLVADIKKLHRAGLEVQAGFIVGFDSDLPDIFQRQIDFIQASAIPTAMVGMLQAPLGTRLFARMEREQRLVGHSTGDNVDGTTNIIPAMGLENLMAGYHRLLREIYAPDAYYNRVRELLRELRPTPLKLPVRKEHLMAMAASALRIGIIARERWEYWKLLGWTIWNRPRSFGTAVALSISGYHLRRFCEEATGPMAV